MEKVQFELLSSNSDKNGGSYSSILFIGTKPGDCSFSFKFNLKKQFGVDLWPEKWRMSAGNFEGGYADTEFEVVEEETAPASNLISLDDILFLDTGKWLNQNEPPYATIPLEPGPYDDERWKPVTYITVIGSIDGELVSGQPVVIEVYRPDGRLNGTYQLYEDTDERTVPGGPRIDTEPSTDGTYFYRHKNIHIGYDSVEDALASPGDTWTVVVKYGQASDQVEFEVATSDDAEEIQ